MEKLKTLVNIAKSESNFSLHLLVIYLDRKIIEKRMLRLLLELNNFKVVKYKLF